VSKLSSQTNDNIEKIIDLTYPLSSETVMYPGLPHPEIIPYLTVENEGANVSKISFVSHAGTHIDAPRHVFTGARTVDNLSMAHLIGDAVVVDITDRNDLANITLSDLQSYEKVIHSGVILLLITGIYKQYGTPAYNENCPALSAEAARWLVKKQIASYATDATSIEVPGSKGNVVHKILLAEGIPIIENLANLNQITAKKVKFIALPLKLKDCDGAPCRVVVIQD